MSEDLGARPEVDLLLEVNRLASRWYRSAEPWRLEGATIDMIEALIANYRAAQNAPEGAGEGVGDE